MLVFLPSELRAALQGSELRSEAMGAIEAALSLGQVPLAWVKLAWPSKRPLASWLQDLGTRLLQLQTWSKIPGHALPVTWLPGLANPCLFMTAVCQVSACKKAGGACTRVYPSSA